MSDAQLSKLKEDRDALAREVNLLQAAIKVEDAADRIVAQLRKTEVAPDRRISTPEHSTPHLTSSVREQRHRRLTSFALSL